MELRRGNARLWIAAGGILLAVVGIVAWTQVVRTVVMPPLAQALGSYLVVWVPLVAAVVVALSTARTSRRAGANGPADEPEPEPERQPLLRLAIRPIDVLWGLGVGFVMRGIAAAIEIAVLGRMSGTGVQLDLDAATVWLVLAVAPVIVGPFVEEWFFRGLVVPTIRDRAIESGARPRGAAATGVVVSALLFGLLHTLDAPTPATMLVTGASAFAFGLAAGALATLTGRLGGAILAHAVYNGLLVLLLLG